MRLVDDVCVGLWRGRVGSSWKSSFRVFERFYFEVLMRDEQFKGLSASQLVDWQANVVGRDRYRILCLAQGWVNGQRLRLGSKQCMLTGIRSFFLHNQAELPADRSFRFSSDVPAVEGKLNPEDFVQIQHNCNKMYRAVFLMMAQGLMGEGELVFVSNNCCEEVLEHLSKNDGVFKLVLPGRKRNRNKKNFFTMLSTRSDWADTMRCYLKSIPNFPKGALFRNEQGNPLTKYDIIYYFHQRAVETGVIKQFTPNCSKCGGDTVKIRVNPSRKIGYTCKECGNVDLASEIKAVFTTVRYGVNPHEIRDLMRSRWGASGAKLFVAEFMMEHDIDPNNYHKLKYTPSLGPEEYRKALRWLNILSEDPEKISRSDVAVELEASQAKVDVLGKEVAALREDSKAFRDIIEVLRDPTKMEKFKKLLKE